MTVITRHRPTPSGVPRDTTTVGGASCSLPSVSGADCFLTAGRRHRGFPVAMFTAGARAECAERDVSGGQAPGALVTGRDGCGSLCDICSMSGGWLRERRGRLVTVVPGRPVSKQLAVSTDGWARLTARV